MQEDGSVVTGTQCNLRVVTEDLWLCLFRVAARAGKGSDVQVGEAGDRVVQEGRRKCQANQSQGNGTSVGNMVENVR